MIEFSENRQYIVWSPLLREYYIESVKKSVLSFLTQTLVGILLLELDVSKNLAVLILIYPGP